jgi:demethylphylloquinone reductase
MGVSATLKLAMVITTIHPSCGLSSVRFVSERAPSTRQLTTIRASSASSSATEGDIDCCDVAVFGGGFGGLYTALSMSRRAQQNGQNLDIVLVDPSPTFVFLPLLYDLTVGTATEQEVCPFYRDLLRGTGVRHVCATVQSVTATPNNDVAVLAGRATLTTANPTNATLLSPLTLLQFRAAVIAVGASPTSLLASIPGAATYAQPFYTATDAKRTRRLLNVLYNQQQKQYQQAKTDTVRCSPPRIAVVGGGYGGVELAACIQRRLSSCRVTLLSRGTPMAGTRAQPIVQAALNKLGVQVHECNVLALQASPTDRDKIVIVRSEWGNSNATIVDAEPWDAVLWTAGSSPSEPVASGNCVGLGRTKSGRLAVDKTLRCCLVAEQGSLSPQSPRIWALGDCAEVARDDCSTESDRSAVVLPKTAQVAMQQAETVAANVLGQLRKTRNGRDASDQTFVYQDLGSMLTLGGPNAVVQAPKDGLFAPIFSPALDTANSALGLADTILASMGRAPIVEQLGLVSPDVLGLSLSSHGLVGLEDGTAPGTLAGTLSGAARRTVYAARMPTNEQRAVSLVSAVIATAVSLAREASDRAAKRDS